MAQGLWLMADGGPSRWAYKWVEQIETDRTSYNKFNTVG